MRSRRHLVIARSCLGAFVSITVMALVWPGPQLFTERVEPFVLGLPFAFFWCVLWLASMFAALLCYHLWTGEEG